MSKLEKLIRNLRAFTVVIIENDFTFVDNPKEILGSCSFTLSKSSVSQIINSLHTEGYRQLANEIKSFLQNWDSITNHNSTLMESMGIGYVDLYLNKIGHGTIIQNSLQLLTQLLVADDDDKLKSIFLRNGIFNDESVPKYKEIFEDLNKIKECRIIIFKKNPNEAEWNNFKTEIEHLMVETKSAFCLSIIDKSLGGGGSEGKELIKRLILETKDDFRYKHICCLYTSAAVKNDLEDYDDYFVQEISKKDHSNATELISKVLAQSAYAEVCNSLSVKTKQSADLTLKTILKNQKNIKYIIDTSQKEGIQPYSALRYWHELSIQNNFDKKELEDFRFVASLTSFFKEEYLDDHLDLSQISDELKELNTYEIFDYGINKKHLPLSPGDIWEINGEFYLLVGQLCDLMLRGSNKRKSKIGELLKISLGDRSSIDEKYEIKVIDGKKSVSIDFFNMPGSKEFTVINIDTSTPNLYFADLEVLDLAMFNESGKCRINAKDNLPEDVQILLSDGKENYFETLKSYYSNMGEKVVRQLVSSLGLSDPLDISRFNFIEDGDYIDHQVKRICRLKGRYFDSLYNNYLNNKGRIDLNLIENFEEEVRRIKLNFELFDDVHSKIVLELNLYISKKEKYIKMSELRNQLPNYEKLFSYSHNEKLKFDENTKYEMSEESEGVYNMKYKYLLNGKNYHGKGKFSFNDLYKKQNPIQTIIFK